MRFKVDENLPVEVTDLLYRMLKHGRDFEGAKFYQMPENVAVGA